MEGQTPSGHFLGGEGTLFDNLAAEGLLEKVKIPKQMGDEIPELWF